MAKSNQNTIRRLLLFASAVFLLNSGFQPDTSTSKPSPANQASSTVFVFKIFDEIGPAALRITKKAFAEADSLEAEYIILHLNTYGGRVDIADSIRTMLLNSNRPVYVYIENNAASAGAFISIAAKEIYMKKGSSIGAASVVNQEGQVMPEKYQSYMRSKMRATAESHGKDTIVNGNDTIYKWKRDPLIAEGMVDPSIHIPGVVDSTKAVTFTPEEAMKHGYCEGIAEDIPGVIKLMGIENYQLKEYRPSPVEKIIGFLLKPIIQSLLIMLIIGGIYFELQTQGVGFPLAAAGVGAILYFAPLYLQGLAENWELALFFAGLILIAVEVFVIPGFGIAGISGIILAVAGLTLSLVDNVVFELPGISGVNEVLKAFSLVIVSIIISFFSSLYLTKVLLTSPRMPKIALNTTQNITEGYTSADPGMSQYVGQYATTFTVLRPGGKVEVDDEIYDAVSEVGMVGKGEKVKITRYSSGQFYVLKEN